MAKKVYKIEAFEGGINQKYDPRDIKDNQLEEAFNVDVSNPGRIVMTGDGAADYVTLNSRGNLVSPAAENNLLLNVNLQIKPNMLNLTTTDDLSVTHPMSNLNRQSIATGSAQTFIASNSSFS